MMKAVVLTANNNLDYRDVPVPTYGPDEILVRVAFCGICGSDLPRVFDNGARSYPIILGHEFSGIVEAIGNNVSNIKAGDHVVAAPLIPCYQCEDCKNGNYSLCNNYSFIGSRRNGAFAEFVNLPFKNIIKLPGSLDLEQAATIEPATVVYHAFNLIGEIKGKNIAVLGCGIIGLFAIQIANILGANNIIAIGRRESGLIQAEKFGAVKCFSTLNKTAEDIKKESNLNGFDIVLDCSGADKTIHSSFELVSKKGTICFVGTPKKELTFSVKEWELINRKECIITGSWMSYSSEFPGKEWRDAINHMDSKLIKPAIDKVYSFSDSKQAFHNIRSGQTQGRVLLRNENF